MTISVQNAYNEYTAPGNVAAFTFDFTVPTYNPTPIAVYQDGVLIGTGDYIITPGASIGGTVTFVDAGAADDAPAAGVKVLIRRAIPIDQEVQLTEYAPFPADAVENELDKLTMISQDLKSMEPIIDGTAAEAKASAGEAEAWAHVAEDEAGKSAASAGQSAASASQSAGYATEAEGHASDAAGSASDAFDSQVAAKTSEDNAATSATESATSATESATSATESATSAAEADATYTEFQDEYWGELYWDVNTPAPNLNPKTNTTPNIGDLFWNTYDNEMYVCATVAPYTWVPTGTTGVSQMLAGQNVELSPVSGKGVVRVTAKATGDVDEVVIGRFEGTLTYNEPIPTETPEGVEIVYRNGDYFIFVGPDGTRTEPPAGDVATGDYCICTTGTKGPSDDYSILEDQIQKNATEISYNDTDIAEIEGSTNVGSTVVLVDGGTF